MFGNNRVLLGVKQQKIKRNIIFMLDGGCLCPPSPLLSPRFLAVVCGRRHFCSDKWWVINTIYIIFIVLSSSLFPFYFPMCLFFHVCAFVRVCVCVCMSPAEREHVPFYFVSIFNDYDTATWLEFTNLFMSHIKIIMETT